MATKKKPVRRRTVRVKAYSYTRRVGGYTRRPPRRTKRR